MKSGSADAYLFDPSAKRCASEHTRSSIVEDFSTNGTYWAGQAGIPAIGFGPGDEVHAHTVLEQVPLEDVVRATEWYTLLPSLLKK